MRDTKVYQSETGGAPIGRASGFFAAQVSRLLPGLPVEDEGRLTNFRIREQFLSAVFTLAAFRELRERASGEGASPREAMRLLTEFHSHAKLLLMAQNQTQMRRLGRIAANPERVPVKDVWDAYAEGLLKAFERPPRPTNAVNVLEHAMGYFKTQLTPSEKRLFLDMVAEYRAGRTPLSAPVAVLRAWIARFGEPYLADQMFFSPYPEELVSMRDSALGR